MFKELENEPWIFVFLLFYRILEIHFRKLYDSDGIFNQKFHSHL